jgi:hypothetical protein
MYVCMYVCMYVKKCLRVYPVWSPDPLLNMIQTDTQVEILTQLPHLCLVVRYAPVLLFGFECQFLLIVLLAAL